jgi:hypothetical protein
MRLCPANKEKLNGDKALAMIVHDFLNMSVAECNNDQTTADDRHAV